MLGVTVRVAACAVLLPALAFLASSSALADPETSRAEAERAFLAGDFPRAITLFLRAKEEAGCGAKRSKRCARLEIRLGVSRASAGKMEGARLAFKRALRHDPAIRLDPERDNPDHVALFERVRAEHRAVVATPKPRAKPLPPPEPTTTPAPMVAPSPAAPERKGRFWSYVVASSAIVVTAAGVGLSLSAGADVSDACDLLLDTGDCDQRTHLAKASDRPQYNELQQRSETKATLATIAWIAAGTLAAGAVALFVLEGRTAAVSEGPRAGRATQRWALSPFGVVVRY